MNDWANVATLGKTKNLKGGLLAYAREGLPFLLEEGLEVVFVPPVLRVPRKGKVVSVQPQGQGAHLVFFDTIDSIELAEKIQDHACLVRTSDLPEDFDRGMPDLVGMSVFDVQDRLLGKVVHIEENPAHALLVVEPDVNEGTPFRIPLVDDFIVEIDIDQHALVVDVPDGLLDL